MKKLGIFAIILLSSLLLPTGCAKKATPAPEQYTGGRYKVWVGPGWYYGVYFSGERDYKNWRKRQMHHYRKYRYRQPSGSPRTYKQRRRRS